MKSIHIIGLSLGMFLFTTGISAQTHSGSGYFLHTITKGQSLYSIASMYNVSVNDIILLNPGSKEQIRTGETLKIPQDKTTTNGEKRFHTIQAGETLYQLTVRYNVSAQTICAANPGLSASNFRIGQVIAIPTSETKAQPSAQPTSHVTTQGTTGTTSGQKKWKDMHKVEKKETIFSISQQYGITQDELIAANPELKTGKLKKGTFLFIPYPKRAQQEKTTTQIPTNEQLFKENARKGKSMTTIKAALLLPFTGANKNEEQSRMVEFYEGFLMAADSMKRKGVSLDIYTYDTQGTASGVNAILSQPVMKDMNIIFGPVHASAIAPVASFAEKHNIRLVVPFAAKVDQVFKSPNVYQINTPQSYLYSEVGEHFTRKFEKANVVFIATGSKEKTEFISSLKNDLKESKISFRQVQLSAGVDERKLVTAMDTLRENIFIPTSGQSSALTQIIPLLTSIRKEHPNFQMSLFGYPEWQTYTQDHLSGFYELDTYFYSSFYTNNLFPAAKNFTKSYRRWYGKDMANIYPKYGMLGYDIGYYFLNALSLWGDKMEQYLNRTHTTPIQTGFKFERVNNWGGFINRKVFFVHFSKDYELIKLDFE